MLLGFILGAIVGSFSAIAIYACLIVAKRADEG